MSAGNSTAMQHCSFRRSSSASGGSCPFAPDQPIQTPPARFKIGSIAVARPPALRLVFHSVPSRPSSTGRRFETTIKRPFSAMSIDGCVAAKLRNKRLSVPLRSDPELSFRQPSPERLAESLPHLQRHRSSIAEVVSAGSQAREQLSLNPVVDTDPVTNPGSTQGGAEWRVTEYQPERKEPPPDLNAVNAAQPDEWEE